MKLNKLGLIFVLCTGTLEPRAWGEAAAGNDSDSLRIGTLPIRESEVWRSDSVRKFNPMISGTASLILPGAGQLYTGHYVKAGFFLALEAIFGSMANFWRQTAINDDADVKRWETAAADTDRVESSKCREESYLSYQQVLEARYSAYNFLAWAIGAHLFNVLDGIGCSNYFQNSKEKKPLTAALLASVPGLGLGQWYNGSLSKAGMVMMGQVSLGLMAYNSQRLMQRAEDNYQRLNAGKADTALGEKLFSAYSGEWSSRRYRAFINRNMYLWYSVFFYGYSLFDAVVDAYLHEYSKKMKIQPDLVLGNKQVNFTLQTTF
jgi:TM2 domain-containing membrane protein YozV